MPEKIAFLFPGQGSQYLGMGQDIASEYPEVKVIFEQVDEICQKPISRLGFEGPMDELTLTVNLQPAITAVNLACMSALKRAGIKPSLASGHSLGEYAALASAGVISGYDALRLVRMRGELMHRESLENPGTMAAVIGLDIDSLNEVISLAREKGIVSIGNHNTSKQIVITGESQAVSETLRLVKEKGAKAIPLKVSGAWHSALMENAGSEFRQFAERIPFSTPQIPVLFNATARSESDPEKIKDLMAHQLVSPVKWYDILRNMLEEGVDVFVEVGPKEVLKGLLKKTIPPESNAGVYSVQDMKSLGKFMEAIR
jgi:[acyl-carrier-protein] S-malonyltransferase